MLASLPTNVPEAKHGPRLMEYVKGEAEILLEAIPVEDLTKAGGDKKIWALLDDKYGPQPRDLMQQALKGYFYDLQVKQSETYVQFLARYEAANRKLVEQGVDLPSPVRGYMLVKKLKLEPTHESMVLTHSQGSLEYDDVVKAVRGIFPDGKGSSKTKDIFLAGASDDGSHADEVTVLDDERELAAAAELLASEFQANGGHDEEEVLESFESYAEVRKKLRDQKTSRGFSRGSANQPQWKLSGTVKGRLEMLKQRTSCHHCHAKGHWKRECPMLKNKSSTASSSSKGGTDVNLSEVIGQDVMLAEDVWELFKISPPGGKNDSGTSPGSPTFERTEEAFFTDVFVHDNMQAGSEMQPDGTLGECAVPDTA